MRFDKLPTPCYVIDVKKLTDNLAVLKGVARRTGAKILLAQKAFSAFCVYPLISQYLDGATASGLYEARLAHEKFEGECHVFSPAYRGDEIDEIISYCDHIVFNSRAQLEKYAPRAIAAGKECGLRINPEHSTQEQSIYDPCSPGSRLGIRACDFPEDKLALISGLHFHTLCEQDSDALEETLDAVEARFGKYFGSLKWLNFGGGHHITRPGYDIARLERCIKRISDKYGLRVYLEPGEAVALNAGYLVTTVLDRTFNDGEIAIIDASAACHMPDVLEMPYRAPLENAGLPGEKKYDCTLGAPTCLAGDVIGKYSFDRLPEIGDRLIFDDMAIYSMVKNNTFNGIALPSIALMRENGDCEIIRKFTYDDFKDRLS